MKNNFPSYKVNSTESEYINMYLKKITSVKIKKNSIMYRLKTFTKIYNIIFFHHQT